MKNEEIQRIIDFHEQVIIQGIIKPLEINDIYCLLHPEEQNPIGVAYKVKQRAISLFVENLLEQEEDEMQEWCSTDDDCTEIDQQEIDSW